MENFSASEFLAAFIACEMRHSVPLDAAAASAHRALAAVLRTSFPTSKPRHTKPSHLSQPVQHGQSTPEATPRMKLPPIGLVTPTRRYPLPHAGTNHAGTAPVMAPVMAPVTAVSTPVRAPASVSVSSPAHAPRAPDPVRANRSDPARADSVLVTAVRPTIRPVVPAYVPVPSASGLDFDAMVVAVYRSERNQALTARMIQNFLPDPQYWGKDGLPLLVAKLDASPKFYCDKVPRLPKRYVYLEVIPKALDGISPEMLQSFRNKRVTELIACKMA